jgi:predicted component of type VI protein secretion system
MTTRTVFFAIAICFVLAGCNTVQPRTGDYTAKKLDCRTAKCEVYVTVACAPFCNPSLDSYAVIISVKNGKDTIAWELPKDSYFSFADKNQGIVFDADGQKVIECNTEQSGRRVVCKDKSQDFGVYKYTVNVVGPLVYVFPLDPWVINN